MGLSRKQQDDLDARRHRVAELYVRRTPKAAIARAMEVSLPAIYRDIAVIEAGWIKELKEDPVAERAKDLAAVNQLQQDASAKYLETHQMGWWDRILKALERRARLLGLDKLPEGFPGSSPATPLFVAEVGYDINELMKDQELRGLILEVDKRMRALAGVGIVEGEVTSVD